MAEHAQPEVIQSHPENMHWSRDSFREIITQADCFPMHLALRENIFSSQNHLL